MTNETKKNRVLIVDDERSNLLALTRILSQEYAIFAAKDGKDAIEVANEYLPDVILLDILMPDMDGYDVISVLKGSDMTRNIPVIFITGLNNADDEEKGLSLGAADYISKPFSPAIVRLRVRNQITLINQTRLTIEKEIAEKSSLAKSEFLSHMSHEIRTPLNAIIGMIYIGLGTGDIEKKNYCFEKADSACKHLLGIINDILDISKVEAGKLVLLSNEIELEKMLANIVNVAKVRAEEKQQNFIININENFPNFIEGDELRLSQVITNLLTNAIKFTPEKGTVILNAEETEEIGNKVTLKIEVSDTGVGISKEQQKQLFAPFMNADPGITKKFGGTGLGLAISKQIIERMGGEIWVESEPGKGSKFTFTIKVKKLSGHRHAKQPADIKQTHKAADMHPKKRYDFFKYTILIAEDIEINREIMSAILEETNVSIDYAENGAIAVSMFRENPGKYDLILMDINMPEMDGYEATREIRALDFEKAKSIPIIAMTANVYKEVIENCVASGMNDHIGKPVDASVIYGMLNKYLLHPDEKSTLTDVRQLKQGIAWDEELMTGNVLVDMQHHKIFERVSNLVALCEEGSDAAKLQDTLGYLINYTVQHFTDEEALLFSYGYPGLEAHKKMHDDFKMTVGGLVKRFKTSGSSAELSSDVNKILIRWLANHIKNEDRKISEYIRAVNASGK